MSFALQSYPRLFNKYFGVDVWTRLIEIDHVRKAGHKIPGKISKKFIIGGYFDYPPLFPLIFSFFPKKTLLKIQGFISPFFDALQNLLVYFIALQLTGDVKISILAQIIYALTPMIAVENSNLTPRSFGYLNFTLAFYPLLLYQINHNIFYLMTGILFTSMLFLSHRFALQSFVFIAVFFTFVDQSPVFLLSLLASFAIALLITNGYYLRVARGHLANIYFWVLNYNYRFAHQIYGNRKPKQLDWVGKAYHFLSVFSPIFIFGINIWIVSSFLFLYLKLFRGIDIAFNPIFYKMSLWIVFFYVFAAIVLKVKRLIPIGEGQRYLEMATVPSSIISSLLFFYFYKIYSSPVLVAFLIAILTVNLALILFIQIKGIIKDKNRSLTTDLEKAFDFINKLSKTIRIICIPHQITTMVLYQTKADVLVNADNPGLLKISNFYPILKKPIPTLAKEHKLTHLLLRESFAKLSDLAIKNPKIIFKSNDILLLKLKTS